MELIGGLVVAVIILAIAGFVGFQAKRRPATEHAAPEESGISEREWMDAIK